MAENRKNIGALLRDGIFGENPLLRLGLGVCPALAVTASALGGLGMGIATGCVLILTGIVLALLGGAVSERGRLPVALVVSTAFATVAQMVLKGWFPALEADLGLFVPLIAVNTLILSRAEFAARNGLGAALADGVGMGLGYAAALTLVGALRELIGRGTLFGAAVLTAGSQPMLMIAMPAGGFLMVGLVMGIAKAVAARRSHDEGGDAA